MPKPFTKLTAIAAPIMRTNIDTDVIIRIDRIVGNSVRGNLGKWAFGALRYLPDGSENTEFVLNREPYRRGNPCHRPELRLRLLPRSRGVVAAGDRHPCRHWFWLRRHFFRQLLSERNPPDRCGQGNSGWSCRGGREHPGRRTYRHRSAGTDDHLALGEATQFRDRSAPARDGLDEVALTLQRDDEIRAFQASDRAERPWIHFARKSA